MKPVDLNLSDKQKRIVAMYSLQWLIDNYLDDEEVLNELLDKYSELIKKD